MGQEVSKPYHQRLVQEHKSKRQCAFTVESWLEYGTKKTASIHPNKN